MAIEEPARRKKLVQYLGPSSAGYRSKALDERRSWLRQRLKKTSLGDGDNIDKGAEQRNIGKEASESNGEEYDDDNDDE